MMNVGRSFFNNVTNFFQSVSTPRTASSHEDQAASHVADANLPRTVEERPKRTFEHKAKLVSKDVLDQKVDRLVQGEIQANSQERQAGKLVKSVGSGYGVRTTSNPAMEKKIKADYQNKLSAYITTRERAEQFKAAYYRSHGTEFVVDRALVDSFQAALKGEHQSEFFGDTLRNLRAQKGAVMDEKPQSADAQNYTEFKIPIFKSNVNEEILREQKTRSFLGFKRISSKDKLIKTEVTITKEMKTIWVRNDLLKSTKGVDQPPPLPPRDNIEKPDAPPLPARPQTIPVELEPLTLPEAKAPEKKSSNGPIYFPDFDWKGLDNPDFEKQLHEETQAELDKPGELYKKGQLPNVPLPDDPPQT